MPHTYTSLAAHIVFATRDRYPFLDGAIRTPVHQYVCGIAARLGAPPIAIGGVADHLHILAIVPPRLSIAEFVNKVKSNSSLWIHETRPSLSKFHWQTGYGAFAVSPSAIDPVRRYIENQEEHHRTKTFTEEFIEFLRAAGIEFDERYLFL